MITENAIEKQALAWFASVGWTRLDGRALTPEKAPHERADGRAVVLRGRLADAVRRLNPGLPADAVEEVVRAVTTPEHPDPVAANRALHRRLLDGVPVTYPDPERPGEKKSDQARLIGFADAKGNDFVVVDQLTVRGSKRNRRPDLILYVNGLPLAVIELKNPADENAGVWQAFAQLQTYKAELPDLFVFNAALVASDGLHARVGALTASKEWFMPWRTIDGADDQPKLKMELEKVVRGFFRPDLFLDYVRYFVLFERDDDALLKKIAGYHQFHGVREAVEATVVAAQREEPGADRVGERRADWAERVKPGSGKAGVFWHTQGSGKSISMAMYAGKLIQRPEMRNPTLVVVTDRTDLDGQLFQQFCAAEDLLHTVPEQADSREELREKLEARNSGGIVFTTVQKFAPLDGEDAHPVLCDRSNVVVISDEAHRSQYGHKPRLDTATGKYVYGYAKHLRDALPNASFIGFTGTPISEADKDTRGVFGDYVSVYDIQDAVDDGATVQIYYESRRAKLDLNHAQIDALNDEVDEVVEGEEDVATRESTKSKWAALAKLVGAKPRLEAVAADLVDHFETRTEALEGKAMVVAMSRDICAAMFEEIVKRRPDWAGTVRDDGSFDPEDGAIRVVMTGSASDAGGLQKHLYTKKQKKRLASRFKDAADPLRLVIVRDMWLTGFDAPCCHTMYVDKPMRGHNLMQAIARTNRVFRDKPGGLIVDYIGIGAELKAALRTYTESKGRGQPTVRAEDALAVLEEKLGVVRAMLHRFDYAAFPTEPLPLLLPAADHLLGVENGKKRFLDSMASVTKAFALCSTLDAAQAVRLEVAFFGAIRSVMVKHTAADGGRSADDQQATLKQILDNAVVSEGVEDVFDLAGVKKPDIGLLSEEFLNELSHLPLKNLAVELLERLLKDEIKGRSENNVVQEKRWGDRLADTMRTYHNRSVEAAVAIQELIDMAADIRTAVAKNEELGLSAEEIAFYDALAEKPEVQDILGDDVLKAMATELCEKLRGSANVDWDVRESVRAKMRLLIKRLLRKYKYPPDGYEGAIGRVIEQAERLAAAWG